MKLRGVFFLCLFFTLSLIISNLVFGFDGLETSENVKIDFNRTHTRAFCSGKNCRDFLVSCSGSKVLDLKPISGFVTFGDDWVDKRKEKALC